MKSQRIFSSLTYLLGVNFEDREKVNLTFLLIHLLINSINIYTSFCYTIKNNWFVGHGIYNILGIIQTVPPFFIQNFLIVRAFTMRNKQFEILRELKLNLATNSDKFEKIFLLRVLYIVVVRMLKYASTPYINYIVFNSQTAFPELIYSCNDLMFVYYVELMTETLEFIKKATLMKLTEDAQIIHGKIRKIFYIKRKIMLRYSVDLLLTLTYNFILTIITFYWLLMRIIFNHLSRIDELASFLHFFEPCFMFWILCSRCELFHRKVNEIMLRD